MAWAWRRISPPLKPSEYARRQLWATFQDDPCGVALYKMFGEDNFMWASDFPHLDSTWPHSREVIKENFASIPDSVTRKIVCDNATGLYRLQFDRLGALTATILRCREPWLLVKNDLIK